MRIDEEFTFGKHVGLTPRELIHRKNGTYLMWCLENVKGFHLEPESFEDAVRLRYGRRYVAVVNKTTHKEKLRKYKLY